MFSGKLKFINKHHLWSLVCSWTYWSGRTGSAGYLPFKWVGRWSTSILSGQRRTAKSSRTFNTGRWSSGTDFIRITGYAGRGSAWSWVRIGCTSSTCCPPIHPSKATEKQQIHTLKLNKLILFWPCLWVSIVLTLPEGQQTKPCLKINNLWHWLVMFCFPKRIWDFQSRMDIPLWSYWPVMHYVCGYGLKLSEW